MNIGKQCLYERSTSFFEPRTDIILGRTISHNVVEPLISGSSLTTSSNTAQLLINHENRWAILHISVLFHMLFAQLKTPFLTSIANSSCSYRTMSSVTWIRKPELIASAELASYWITYDYHHLYCSRIWFICMTLIPTPLEAETLYLLWLAGTVLIYKVLLAK